MARRRKRPNMAILIIACIAANLGYDRIGWGRGLYYVVITHRSLRRTRPHCDRYPRRLPQGRAGTGYWRRRHSCRGRSRTASSGRYPNRDHGQRHPGGKQDEPRATGRNPCAHGHPIGATGAILTTRLIHSMRRDGLTRGMVTLCIGGGQGIALALEMLP